MLQRGGRPCWSAARLYRYRLTAAMLVHVDIHQVRLATRYVPSSNYTSADDQADNDTTADTSPDLTDELFVHGSIMLGTKSLFEEGEEDRDNDTGLETLAEADEEDC